MKTRIQLAIFAGLILTFVAMQFGGLLGGGDGATDPVAASSEDLPDIVIGSVRVPDVALRIDLLERERESVRPNSVRNIFAYNIPRPPPPPKPDPVPEEVVEVEKEPPPPPVELSSTIPPAPYRFFGIAEGGRAGGRRVFLTDGESIYNAGKGELVENRYRVVQIGDQNLELEDTKKGHRWIIPFDAGS